MNEMVAAERRVRINGDVLRGAIDGAGLSQAKLARLVGVSQPTVWAWCRGGGTTARNLAALASSLRVAPESLSPDWIVEFNEASESAPTQ